MNRGEHDLIDRCVERLRELPFIDGITLIREPRGRGGPWDALLRVATPKATTKFLVEAKRTHLTKTLVAGVIAQGARFDRDPWILFAPHVGRPLGKHLDEQGVNYVDLAGNCHLQIGRQHIARVEGRPPERRPPEGRGMGPAGLQVLFALLARPALADEPVRTIGKAVGVAAATAADRLAQLRAEGWMHETGQGRRLTEPRRLLDQWVKGYETLVRPRLLIGRYRTQETDPLALERRIEEALGKDLTWAFGGGAAAHRLIGCHRGPETVVHAGNTDLDLAKRLRALPADDGPLILFRAPGPVAFDGVEPRTVAPLLVYTELLHAGDDRAIEAAGEIRKRYLGALS